MKLQKYFRSSSGTTLTELMVTVAIAGTLMGIAVPSFNAWLPTWRLSDAAQQVSLDWKLARAKAISQGNNFRLSLVGGVGATSYELEREFPLNSNDYIFESGPFDLPEGITVSAVGPHPFFSPRGTPNEESWITLSNGTEEQKIELNAAGMVSIPEN